MKEKNSFSSDSGAYLKRKQKRDEAQSKQAEPSKKVRETKKILRRKRKGSVSQERKHIKRLGNGTNALKKTEKGKEVRSNHSKNNKTFVQRASAAALKGNAKSDLTQKLSHITHFKRTKSSKTKRSQIKPNNDGESTLQEDQVLRSARQVAELVLEETERRDASKRIHEEDRQKQTRTAEIDLHGRSTTLETVKRPIKVAKISNAILEKKSRGIRKHRDFKGKKHSERKLWKLQVAGKDTNDIAGLTADSCILQLPGILEDDGTTTDIDGVLAFENEEIVVDEEAEVECLHNHALVEPTSNKESSTGLVLFQQPTFWATARQDMIEASPLFPDNADQIRQSIGGYAVSLLIRKSQLMPFIRWEGSQLTIYIKQTTKRADQISALERSCQMDVPISLFAERGNVPWGCTQDMQCVYVGDFQFMEWRADADDHRIILQHQSNPITRRECYFTAPKEAELSSSLFQGIACSNCLCALPALEWSGWRCQYCKEFFPAPPIRVQLFRHFAKANISFSGPRMDNGKAFLDESGGASRQLMTWNDGIKSAHYSLSSSNSWMQLYHLLSSSDLEQESTRMLNILLNRSMPYRRCKRKKAFHASFRAPDITNHPTPALYDCHLNEAAPESLSGLVDVIDQCIARFVVEPVGGFNEVSVIVSAGDSADLLNRAEGEEGIAMHRAIYHLGPSAQVTIRSKDLAQDMASITLSHGDMLYIPNCISLRKELELKVLHSEVSLTCICRHLVPSDSYWRIVLD